MRKLFIAMLAMMALLMFAALATASPPESKAIKFEPASTQLIIGTQALTAAAGTVGSADVTQAAYTKLMETKDQQPATTDVATKPDAMGTQMAPEHLSATFYPKDYKAYRHEPGVQIAKTTFVLARAPSAAGSDIYTFAVLYFDTGQPCLGQTGALGMMTAYLDTSQPTRPEVVSTADMVVAFQHTEAAPLAYVT